MGYISKAAGEVSDDASLAAFCVQSVLGGASRSRQGERKRKSLYAAVEDRNGRSTRACKADRASRAS